MRQRCTPITPVLPAGERLVSDQSQKIRIRIDDTHDGIRRINTSLRLLVVAFIFTALATFGAVALLLAKG